MAEVIAFPQRVETKTLHFDEKDAFGDIGRLMLSLVQEQGHPDGPITLVLLGGVDGFLPLESFGVNTRRVRGRPSSRRDGIVGSCGGAYQLGGVAVLAQ